MVQGATVGLGAWFCMERVLVLSLPTVLVSITVCVHLPAKVGVISRCVLHVCENTDTTRVNISF